MPAKSNAKTKRANKPLDSASSLAATPSHAGLGRRLAAMVYDSFLVFGLLFVAALIPSLLFGINQPDAVSNETVVHELNPMLEGLGFQLYLLSVMAAFFCWFWHQNGQTLAMQAWRLQVETLSGQRPSWKQCLLRWLGAWLSLLALGAGYWWLYIDSEKRCWHDRLSGTRVVLLPKKPKT